MSKLECPPAPRLAVDDCGLKGEWIKKRQQLGRPAPRFTAEEWHMATTMTHEAAEAGRQVAEQAEAESIRACDEALEISRIARADVDWKFQERVNDMIHWRDELVRKFGEINSEVDAQMIYRERVNNALATMCQILDVNMQIISLRDCRVGIDLVHDEPQKNLTHELKIVQGIQAVLKRTFDYCTERVRLLRKTAYNLDKELKDKNVALQIDQFASTLNVHRVEVQPQCGVCVADYSNVNEYDWAQFTKRNKETAEKNINASVQLRTEIDSLLRQACEDIQQQLCITNRVFEIGIKKIKDVKETLEKQHADVTVNIRQLEGTICKVSKAFDEKKLAVALAETQMSVRGRRPNLELVKDAVQRRLILEIHELNLSMSKLNSNILQGQQALRGLFRNQLELEDAINIKVNTLAIDETQVMPLRRTIRIQEY